MPSAATVPPQTSADGCLRSVLDALPARVAVLDRAGRILSVNAAWRRSAAADPVIGAVRDPGADLPAACESAGSAAGREIAAGIRDVAAGRRPAFSREYRTDGTDGRRWFAVRISPYSGADAGGAVVCHEDRTERWEAEHGRDVQFAVTRIVSESATAEEAYPRLLAAVCAGLEWDFGEIWTVDAAGDGPPMLRIQAAWHPPDLPLARFAESSRGFSFARGAGLPGRAWATGRPEWMVDAASDVEFVRRRAAAEHGLHGAAAFPVPGPGGVVGVLVVFSREVRAPEPETAAIMADLGTRLGHFIVRKRAQRAVSDAKMLYESLVETLPQSIYRTDLQGRVTFGNRHYCAALGRPWAELAGKTGADLFPADLAAKYAADDRRVIETGRPLEEIERHRTPDGRLLYVQVVKAPVCDSAGRVAGIQGIFWDITERKELEDDLHRRTAELEAANQALRDTQLQLVAQERLAALGQLTAGVAHEVNTPLAFLNNNLAVIERDIGLITDVLRLYRDAAGAAGDGSADLPGRLAEIARREAQADIGYAATNLGRLIESSRKGIRRVRQIVVDLGCFSRLDQAEYDQADLDACLDATLELLSYELKKKSISVSRDYGGLSGVPCRPAKLNQVFLNIILNAAYAGPEGSALTISTRRRGDEAVVEIRDQGCGMTPEVRKRIFDPFFTTKPVGEGTGLGLSICYGIVRDHGGRIEVESEPGRGSLFRIILPASGLPDLPVT